MEKLAETYFFRDLDAADLEILKGITKIREVKKGETILAQGQPSVELFIVRTGSVRVMLPAAAGMVEPADVNEQTLVVMGPGECFGEFAFVDRNPTSAAVQAAEDGSVYALSHEELDRTLLQKAESAAIIYKALLHILVTRFRNTDIELAMRNAFGG